MGTIIKTVGIWLIIKNGADKGKIVLQKRAAFEKRGGEIIFQLCLGVCQPSCNGTVDKNEKVIEAATREIREEFGSRFADDFPLRGLVCFDVREYVDYLKRQAIGYNFVGAISQERFKKVKLHQGAQKFVAVDSKDMSRIKKFDIKSQSDGFEKEIILFQDQYESLRKLFALKKILLYLK